MTDEIRAGKQWFPLKWTGEQQTMTVYWTLKKGKHTASSRLVTHALGGEMVCSVAGELRQSKASNDLSVLEAAAEEWRQAFIEKGWAQ
jgi:hypothetical protein